MFDPIHQDRQT